MSIIIRRLYTLRELLSAVEGNTKISCLYFLLMTRLNDRAFSILVAEIQKSSTEKLMQVQQDIVLKRLARLHSSPGSPASLGELRDTIEDFFPNFSQEVLKSAAKANSSSSSNTSLINFNKLKFTAGVLLGSVGVLWVVNLPYPMIRIPVARTAPILLLPSYLSMDYHYRQAIAQVEQADQLINHATSSADLSLGEDKVKSAQKHLDALPVWFLGYSPQYTFWFGWRFTLDEFESARANIGRMSAKLFQEQNAQDRMQQAQKAIAQSKQQYQQGKTQADKQTAITSMQAAIAQLEQLPPQTLAGRTAQTELVAAKHDQEQFSDFVMSSTHSNTLIAAAQTFAIAAQTGQNTLHTASEWQAIADLWDQAILRLKQVEVENPGYIDAQKLLAKYQTTLGTVRTRLQAEKDSQAALWIAKDKIPPLLASNTDNSLQNQNQAKAKLQDIINHLEIVQSGTTAYAQAQQLLESAQKKLNQLQSK